MEFRGIKAQYKEIKDKIDRTVIEIMEEGNFIGGAKVKELEEKLAHYVGVKHCISCANGTDALMLALMAWGIGEGDAVFVPDFTFFSTAEVVSFVGAQPVFVDVDADTFNISIKDLEMAIKQVMEDGTYQPKAIIGVDLFGLPADFAGLKKIAQKYGLLLLEDAAQGFGGQLHGQKACSFGDIGSVSFFPVKPLGCYGDGGAVFTDDDGWAKMLRSLCVHGKGQDKYDNVRIGCNSRLDTLQAAVLLCKLEIFKEYELEMIGEKAKYYTDRLKSIVKTPQIPDGYLSSWAQYTICLKDSKQRDGLKKYLEKYKIPSMIYYRKPMHRQEAFKDGKGIGRECPVAESLCQTVLSLPIHPYLSREEQEDVIERIKEYCGNCPV